MIEQLVENNITDIGGDPDPSKSLYEKLRYKNYYTKSFDEFKRQYNSPESIDKIYNRLSSTKEYTKSKKDFYTKYFPSIKVSGISAPLPDYKNISKEERALLESGKILDVQLPKEKESIELKFDDADPVKSFYTAVDASTKRDFIRTPETSSIQGIKHTPEIKNIIRQEEELKRAEQDKNKISELQGVEEKKKAENFYLKNQDVSVDHLMKLTGIKDPSLLYSDEFDNVIKRELRPGNKTDELAYKSLQSAKNAVKSLSGEDDLVEAAIKYEAKNNPDFEAQLNNLQETSRLKMADINQILEGTGEVIKNKGKDVLGESTIGRILFKALNDPVFLKEAQRLPYFNIQLKQEKSNLLKQYPEFGKVYLGNIISQRLEDMGKNNSILNVVTKEEADSAVKNLQDNGELTPQEVFFYQENIRPNLGLTNLGRTIIGKPSIETTGAVENILKGGVATLRDIGQGAAEISPAYKFITSDKEALSRDIEREASRTDVKSKGLLHDISRSGGQLFGQVMATGTGGGLLKSLKLVNNARAGIGLIGAIQSYGAYMPQARMTFPNDKLKQEGYATIMAGINYFTEQIFNDKKVVDGLMGKIRPDVVKSIRQFSNKEISALQAREMVQNGFKRALKDVPEATTLSLKAIGENTLEEVGAEVLGQYTKGVFEGKPINEMLDTDQIAQVAKTALLGSPFIATLAIRADLKDKKGITAEQIYDMALNKNEWIEKINEYSKLDTEIAKDAAQKIDNLNFASGVVSDLEGTNYTKKEKERFLLAELENKIKKEKIETLTSDTLKKKEKEGIKENDYIKENILAGKSPIESEKSVSIEENPEDKKAVVKEFFENGLIPEQDKMLLTDEKGVFDESKAEDYLKYISQQALGVDENGTSLQGGPREKDMLNQGYEQSIIDFAKEKFPYKINEQEQKTTENAIPIESTDEVDVQPETRNGEKMGERNNIPEEPTGEKEKSESQKEKINLSHEGTKRIYEEYNMAQRLETPNKSDIETEKNADKLVSDGYDFDKQSEKIMNGEKRGLSDEEFFAYSKAVAALKAKQKGLNINDPLFNQLQDKIEKYSRAADVAGTQQARDFRARRLFMESEETLSDFIMQEKEDTGVFDLTDDQKATVQKEFDELKKAEKEYQDKIKSLETENERLKAEATIKGATNKIKNKKKDFAAERKEIYTSIKDKLKKSRSETSAVAVPYAKELILIAPDVAKLVKSYVEQGITELADVVKKIHSDLKQDIPDIKEKDVLDLISGKYNEKKPTKTDLAIAVENLKIEAKLLDKLDKLENGVPPKTEKQKINRNKQITELREKIKELRKQTPRERSKEEKLSAAKTRIKNEINRIQTAINKGDYSPDVKATPLELDEEAIKLKDKLIEIRNERAYRRMKNILKNQKANEKLVRWASDILNVPRSIMSSFDFSAILRQGLLPTLSNPKMALKGIGQMWKSVESQKNYDRWFYDLEKSPTYKLMQDSKLAITEAITPELKAREEEFMSNLAEKIPVLGKGIKKSNRAYSMYLNYLRANLFNQFTTKMRERGVTWDNNPEAYKQMAAYINNSTGRGDLGETLNRAAPLLNTIFFSPRLIASRLNMLTYLAQPRFYKKVPKEVRIAYFKDMATTIGIGLAVLQLAKLNGAEVEDDPRSADFGKIKVGNNRWDIWGGFQQYVRLAAQGISGQSKSTTTGKILELDGEGPYGRDRADIGKTFLRGKLAPAPSIAIDLWSGRNIIGEKIDLSEWQSGEDKKGKKTVGLGEYLGSHLFPLTATGTYEAYKDGGPEVLATVLIPAMLGIGTQTYESKPPAKGKPKKSAAPKPQKPE